MLCANLSCALCEGAACLKTGRYSFHTLGSVARQWPYMTYFVPYAEVICRCDNCIELIHNVGKLGLYWAKLSAGH